MKRGINMVTHASKSKAGQKQPLHLPRYTTKAFYQEEHTSSQRQFTDLGQELVVAEYNALMTQLNSRQSIRYQMVQLALAALGALLTVSSVSIQTHIDSFILAYPVLALLLSIIFVVNAFEASRIKKYIKTRIEVLMPSLTKEQAAGWHHYKKEDKLERLGFGTVGNVGAKLVFMLTAFFAVGIGWQVMQHSQLNNILLYVALGASVILTLLLLTDVLYKLAHKLVRKVKQSAHPEKAN